MARLDQGKVIFNDSSSLSSAGSIYFAQVLGTPTNLSQFTNNLGNYGNWLTYGNISASTVGGFRSAGSTSWSFTWDGVSQMHISNYNCACLCNC